MKNYIILIFLCILFIGCSSSNKVIDNTKYDKRKILFLVNYSYKNYSEIHLIDEFMSEFKTSFDGSFLEPINFEYIKSVEYEYNSSRFIQGYLNFVGYGSMADKLEYVFSDDRLLNYRPDEIIFISFGFEYTVQWNEARKIEKVYIYDFNSTNRDMNKIIVENSLFSSLSKKTINNLSEPDLFKRPKYDSKKIVTQKLSEISKDLDDLITLNEYGSSTSFNEKINEINLSKNRLANIESHIQNSELQVELDNLNNKLNNKIFDTYVSYSENQIDKKESIKKYKELLEQYELNLSKEHLLLINNNLQQIYDTNPYISLETQGWSKLNNSSLSEFSNLLTERVQNIWHFKDTINYSFQYKNDRPVALIIDYHSKEFPFSYINIDNHNYSIIDAIGVKLLYNLLDNFALYGNYVPELTYDLNKFLANLIIYYHDSKGRSVGLYCFAYGNTYDGLNIKVTEVSYKQKSWSNYELIKSKSNLTSAISFTTFEKDFLYFLSIK